MYTDMYLETHIDDIAAAFTLLVEEALKPKEEKPTGDRLDTTLSQLINS